MDKIIETKKKKPYSSITYTTGDPALNIKHFNKLMGTDFNNPSTEEAKAQKAAEKAAVDVGTIAAASPDGGNSVSLGGGGESTAMSEKLILDEDSMYVAKFDQDFELPDEVKILDKAKIEAELEKLEPEEEFEVGYITPVYFYRELLEHFTLLKCTQLVGYTGVDYIEARANDDENKEKRIQVAKDTTALDNAAGIHLDRRPMANKVGDFSAQYASTNKTVLQNNGNTLLFYPRVGSHPIVTYFLDIKDGNGYFKVKREALERTILKRVAEIADELITGVKKDGTPRKRRWGDAELAAKIRRQLETDAATIDAVELSADKNAETRSKISNGMVAKPQVRALYTGQIYYLKTKGGTLGRVINESLNLQEAKRYVRRYYIRPQNVFCSNKTDILQALIQFEDQNCSVYTLNTLGDVKDVTKLTNKDIIYYYDEGILYDKNHVRIMDYDLYVKREQDRKKIDPDTVSDATFADVYDDRITDLTRTDEAFELTFDDVNVFGETLIEGKVTKGTCCICGEEIEGYGNNPEPYTSAENGERCCDACNLKFVIPARLELMKKDNNDQN